MPVIQHSFDELVEIVGGTVEQKPINTPDRIFISTDSRVIPPGDHVLFFALEGPNFNGHQFIYDAAAHGAFAAVVSDPNVEVSSEMGLILVDDTLKALQRLAAHHRSQFNYPVLAITGSYGKTLVKEWLYELLRREKNIIRSPKSYNSQLGVALSLLLMRKEHDMAIIEAGISHPGEMRLLEEMIRPTEGIMTGFGVPHRENFTDEEEHLDQKMLLFHSVERLYLPLSMKKVVDQNESYRFVPDPEINKDGSFSIDGLEPITIPFTDDIHIRHAATAAWYLKDHGYEPQLIRDRMKGLQPIALRLEQFEGVAGCQVINDAYHSDIESLRIALEHQQHDAGDRERTLILSDLVSDRSDHKEVYAKVGQMIETQGVDNVIVIGEEVGHHLGLFPDGTLQYDSVDDFLNKFHEEDFRDSHVLIKGARKFRFERIAKRFQQKAHETVLEIDLDALSKNYHHFHAKLEGKARIMAMVKAFSYGAGSGDIARELERNRVAYLGVAYADEGVQLRKEGIKTPVMVMNPDPEAHETMIENKLEPVIFSFDVLDEFIRTVIDTGQKAYPIHIELDTGMRRLGFDPKDADEIINMVQSQPEVKVVSIFTHLAASEDPGHDDFTEHQIETFRKAGEHIRDGLGYDVLLHAANSAAISRFPHAHFDMVRLGISLYGVPMTEEDSSQLNTVGTLKTRISQIKNVGEGESVGYGRSETAKVKIRIAVLPIGYADGLSRSLSNGKGYVMINGIKAPIFGKVCMDMTMVDVSNIDAKVGDEVIIFGEEPSIEEFAAMQDTIPYEVLAGISSRVKRVYVKD